MVMIFLSAIFITFVGAIKINPHSPSTPNSDLDLLRELYNTVTDMQDGIYNFWITFGPDNEFGAFYNTIDKSGQPVLDNELQAAKNTIMQCRHLYSASKIYLTGRHPKSDTKKIIDLMNSQYEWIINHFITYKPEPVYQVSRDGKKVFNGEIQMFFTDFFIYGMSYFSMAVKSINSTRSQEALDYAIAAYTSVHQRLYDKEYGGYDQSKEGNFFEEYGRVSRNKILPRRDKNAPLFVLDSTVPRGQDWSGGSKGFNAHMHMLEALTALYQASDSPYIYTRLEELLGHYMNDILKGFNFHPLVMYKNWTALGDIDNSYGHDIETCHLIQEAGETVNYTSASKVDIDAKVIEIAKQVQFYGYDITNGGIFTDGVIGLGTIQYEKVYQAQAEAILGFWRVYYVTGDSSYLETIKGVLDFYINFMLVEEIGEFYDSLYLYCVDCSINPNLYNEWKASYHNMRGFLTFLEEVEIFLKLS